LISPLSTDIVLIIHVLYVFSGVVLGLLSVNVIESPGLDELVNLCASESNEKLLGELVGDWLAWEFLQVSLRFVGVETTASRNSPSLLACVAVLQYDR
jgi:hypothetical protein